MKTFKEFLLETPLLDDWNSAIYSTKTPFKRRLAYATKRATEIGRGSSRVVFKIPYEGRLTALKIAKNPIGMAQNTEEVKRFNNPTIKELNITIPMIDYDKENAHPTWIHTEYAISVSDIDFVRACGYPLSQLFDYAKLRGLNGDIDDYFLTTKTIDHLDNNPFAQSLASFFKIVKKDPLGDYNWLHNWGRYKGKPVIIDVGLSDDVWDKHYSFS